MNAKINVIDVLDQAVDHGISIFLEDGKLKMKVDKTKQLDKDFVNTLKFYKEDIIDFLDQSAKLQSSSGSGPGKIQAFNRDEVQNVPLSFAQERMWFIDKLSGSLHYHMPKILRIQGPLRPQVLHDAIQDVVNRHEVLRTVFREDEGIVFQEVLAEDQWPMTCTLVEPDMRAEELNTLIDTEINRPFDLSSDHMLRGHLFRFSNEEYKLVLVFHHIASDGWSDAVFLNDLMIAYEARKQGLLPDWQELPVQYADFAYWQRNYLQGEVLEQKMSYWENKLAGVEELNLPLDFPRPPVKSSAGDTLHFPLSPALSKQLNELAKKADVTPFMLLLAAFKVLLYKHTGQSDICVGTPIANRTQQEIEALVGLFLNTLALRSDLSGNPRFDDFLATVKTSALEAYANQDIPFERIVDRVEKQRDMRRSPLFQVMFVLHNNPEAEALKQGNEEGELTITAETFEYETSKFDLTLFVRDREEGMLLSFEYCTDLFKAESIKQMAIHFENLLKEIVNTPEVSIGMVDMLTSEEKYQLLHDFNDTAVSYPQDQSIVDLVEATARQYPEKVAVQFEGVGLTYAELLKKSNQLANHLLANGLTSGAMVGVCVDRSLEMIIGILAILKTGGAYVPLDPEYPQERIKNILEDTQIQYVLSKSYLQDRLPFEELQITALDTLDFDQLPEDNVNLSQDLEQVTYVIFTSGSTGRPKGVKMHNHALVNLLFWQQDQCENKESRRTLQFASLNFDVSFQEIFSTLCFGGTLFLITEEKRKDAAALLQLMKDQVVSHIFVPFIVLDNLAEYAYANQLFPESLEEIITAGEQLKLTEAIRNLVNQTEAKLINQYGPSESHVVSAYEVLPDDFDNNPLPPIGEPIANTQLYILDSAGGLCPVKTPGELYIGGIALSSGYVNRDELTAEKFVTLNIEGEPKQVYKTGDLCFWLPDGNINFIGRRDDQVKIRGHRVELGEVESIFVQSPQVNQCVVLAKKDPNGNKRLVAYVVPEGAFDKESILAYVKAQLPDYMVPSLVMALDKLPVTPNGKVAKRALPDPDASELITNPYQAPRNELEEQLADIWKAILKVEKVGVYDDFFELGGHSLLATRVVSAIRKELARELNIRDVFTKTTIAQLAAHLESEGAAKSQLPALQAVERPVHIPLSYAQERLWFIDQLGGSLQYHMPMVLNFEGALDKEVLEQAFQQIVNRHEVLRTVFVQIDGKGYQRMLPENTWSLDFEQVPVGCDQKQLQEQIEAEICQPFNLSQDHVLRAKLYQHSTQQFTLVLVIHHIASDGWSMPIFMAEMQELYMALSANRQPNLPVLNLQYADYAIWQKQYLEGEVLKHKLNYWEQQLSGVQPLNLPTDFTRPALATYEGAGVNELLDKELQNALHQLAQKEGVTLFMLLLSAFKVLLHKYSGSDDICVGTPIANRTQAEVEPLIGFFVNNLAIRNQVDKELPFRQFLESVRQSTLEAYDHQEVPFEKIVERVEEQRDRSRTPIFQVSFVLQNNPDVSTVELDEESQLKATIENSGYEVSKYDLSLCVEETEAGLNAGFVYAKDLFLSETMQRMLSHFKQLLSAIVANSDTKIKDLEILTDDEINQLLKEFNDTDTTFETEETLVACFEAQVAQTPENVAVVFEDQQLTYAELNAKANALAHFLQEQYQLEVEDRVGLKIERSEWMPVAILGILKSGAAYVPIDLAYPEDRIQYMLEDSDCKVVLDEQLLAEFQKNESTYSLENLNTHLTADHLAYLIYTSGSTGQPKACMLEHRGIVNFIQHQIAYFGITEEENILHLANIAFDPSVEQLFLALLSGARVTILSKAAMLEEGYISSVIKTEGITHLHSVPSLLQTIPYDDYPELKRVISAGEACKVQLAEQWSKTYDFYNKYGPSEASISCAEYKYEAAAVSGNIVPIGYPTANTQIYILDESLNLLPVGVVGEICISGAGLARGYWNKPELTAQRFVTHPFIPEAKLYRTGDLGRWDANGNIEFIGRKDNQVKIRGHRVELGEINYQLQQSGVLNQGIVVSHTSNTGENYLAAYVVPSTNYDIDSIRTYLQKCLPGYMVPAVFVELETLPLTPNGKIDYKALPKPGEQRRTQNAYLAARNSIESRLVEIWSQFLDASPVGVQDNFFDLGGHSLLALQIMAKINQSFEKRLPIADLFEFPTIEALAQQIAQSEEITDEARLISLNQNSATYNWFCVPAAEGNVMAFSNWAKQLEGTANVYAFQPQGLMGLSAPLQTVEAMAETYLELLLDTQDQGPFYLAGYSFGAKVAYQIAFLLEQRGYEVAQVIIFDAVAAHKQLEKPNLEQVDYAFWLAELGAHLAGLYGKTCNLSPTDFNQANQAAQFEYLFDKMTALGLDISFEQVKGFAQVYLNNIHCNYEPKLEQLPNFPIHLYKARDVSSMDERLQQGILKTEDYGWQDLTTGRVRATWLEGDHWSVLSAAHTALVTENLVHPIPQLISSAYES